MSTGGIQLTQEQFCKDIYNLYGKDYSIVSQYNGLRNKVLIKHNICGNVFEKTAGNVRRKNVVLRCPCEINNGHRVMFDKNINSIAVTNPELAKLFLNQDDSWKYTFCSAKRTNFKCPTCGNIIRNKMIYNVYLNGLKCECCSNKMSMPEKFIYTFLKMNSDALDGNAFSYDKTTEWSLGRRYDFLFSIGNTKYIIEAHGSQHYEDSKLFKRSVIEEQENDLDKLHFALKNGVSKENYIVIDCRESNIDFIKNNIIKSKLNDIFDLNNFDWHKCVQNFSQSLMVYSCELYNKGYKSKDISEKIGLHQGTICKYLRTGTKFGLCNFVDSHKKKVKCINTNVVFDSITEAIKYYGIKDIKTISNVCKGKKEYCINPYNKEKLYWEFV